jgi:hypothetical protein
MKRLALMLLLLGCGLPPDGPNGPIVCLGAASVEVFVVDAGDNPVTDATVTSVMKRTGEHLEGVSHTDNRYTIATDAAREKLTAWGDTVTVTAVHDISEITEIYFLRAAGCALAKDTGPDTLRVP